MLVHLALLNERCCLFLLQKYHFLAYATRVYHKNTNVPQGVFAGFQWVIFLAVAKKYKCRTSRCLTRVKHHSMHSTWFSKSSGHNERRRMRERYE